jgi:penicillin-binding protein A
MQDFKDIDKQTRSRGGRPSLRNQRVKNDVNEAEEIRPRQQRLKFLLPVIALLLAGYPLLSLFDGPRQNPASAKPAAAAVSLDNVDNWSAFRLAADAFGNMSSHNGTYSAPLPQGGTVVYAINDEVQRKVEKVMRDYKVPYGMFVAMEPKTGKIIAAVSHSELDPKWANGACYHLYPMASLFKIITATAALEEKKVTANTPFAFNGRLTSESPKYWRLRASGNQEMPLATAMGKSVNPVFGRLAGEVVGRDPLLLYAQRYGFNQNLFPGSNVLPSTAPPPATEAELMRMGAGLNRGVKSSPFHAAAIMATIANDGIMMAPSLASEIRDAKGNLVYSHKPQQLRTVTTPVTAAALEEMLSTTVKTGTSRRAFHDRSGRPMLGSVSIAAKTGSIDGDDPVGHYSWFAAYAPMEDPQIAIAALVINQNKWRIKATSLGEMALEAYFR